MKNSIVLLTTILLIVCGDADTQTVSTGGQLLKMGVGARALSMGEAYCGVADDATAVFWNIAGLTGISNTEILLQHTIYLLDIQRSGIVYGRKVGAQTGFGALFDFLWTQDEIRDAVGDVTGSFTSYYARLILGYAYRPSEKLSLGGSMELLVDNLHDSVRGNTAINIGLLYTPGSVSVGFTVQNIQNELLVFGDGDAFDPGFTRESIPEVVKLGIGYNVSNAMLIAVDYDKANDDNGCIHAGVEYAISSILAIRAGYTFESINNELGMINGLTTGIGIMQDNLTIDFLVAPKGDLGTTYTASLKMSL